MAQTLTAPVSGLVSAAGAPVPLLGVSAEATIRDFACRLVLSQRFRNQEDRPIEAVYKFPLDEGAAVCGFEAEIDGRKVVGRVEEREKAFETYDDAMAEGHGAYLLDAERADVFTVSVGNLPPGKEAVLRVSTVRELPLEGDAIRFTLPTTLAPRYAPAADREGVGETEAERVSPPHALSVPYGLTLRLDVEATAPVLSVESPTHPVAVTIQDGRATLTLSEREAALDRDVVVRVALAESHQPRAVVERAGDGRSYALVSFRPTLEARAATGEVVFLVDRSGSMQGTSIAEARNALQLALRSLRPGSFFNVVGFGSEYSSLFPQARAYDESSLAEATAHVKALDADLGGTEILPALEHVLAAPPREGLARQVFVLTDGQVSNADAVIALARRHAGRTRVFTFGIGAAASHHLVQGLARAGEGEAEFIAPGERIEGKVMRQLARALTPALTDVKVDWGGLGAEQAPYEVPPVFAGGRVLVFARIEGAGKTTVTLRAVSPDGPVAFPLAVDPTGAAEGTLVATLWARHLIRDLEEGRSALHPRRGSQQKRAVGLKDEQVEAEIVRLGTTWGLVSRHTSFVAVETRETPVAGEAQLRKVAVAIPRGWHGFGLPPQAQGTPPGVVMGVPRGYASVADYALAMARRSAPSAPGAPFPIGSASIGRRLFRTMSGASPGGESRSREDTVDLRRESPQADLRRAERPVDALVALQRADGSWALDDDLARALGWRKAKDLGKALHRRLAGESEERAFATALALAWLERECHDSVDEWRLLAAKGREWLARAPDGVEAWLEQARKVLESGRA
jgi:Ca-activated chloride channel family protein